MLSLKKQKKNKAVHPFEKNDNWKLQYLEQSVSGIRIGKIWTAEVWNWPIRFKDLGFWTTEMLEKNQSAL